MPHESDAFKYPDGIFKQTTPDETQDLRDGPRYCTVYKGVLTRSEIYERLLPDKQTAALRIDGPIDNGGFLTFDSRGQIILATGKRDKELGDGSGKLCIHTHGQQQKHEEVSHFEYNAGEGEKEALNIIAYGDVTEEAEGSQRTIKAQKIIISAEEELVLVGKSGVIIQSGSAGGGKISMQAGDIEKITNNDREIILGQRLTFGVSEDTTISFDPRANQSIISPGHINWKILGDYSQWVGGVSQTVIAGNPIGVPLVEDRSNSYSIRGLLGNISTTAVVGNYTVAATAGATTLTSGAAFTAAAGGQASITSATNATVAASTDVTVSAGGVLNLTAIGVTNIKGAIINLN